MAAGCPPGWWELVTFTALKKLQDESQNNFWTAVDVYLYRSSVIGLRLLFSNLWPNFM
jgi:hypothetical protein